MSVRCCGEADESNGAEHAVWCHNYDLAKGFAAARREGWAQAIEALRDDEKFLAWYRSSHITNRTFAAIAADYLTARAAALTEEGQ